jgi:hypothetical protein
MIQSILDALSSARSKLQPFFLDSLPPSFGQTTVWMLQERLRAVGLERMGVVEECIHTGCDLTTQYLQQGGTPGRPELLFQGLCCHALESFLDDWLTNQVAELLRLLEGEVAFESCHWEGDPRILEEVHRAIEHLPPPFIDFMTLCFSEAQPEDVIRERLCLADHEEYLQLSRLSLAALRNEIERRFRT